MEGLGIRGCLTVLGFQDLVCRHLDLRVKAVTVGDLGSEARIVALSFGRRAEQLRFAELPARSY